MMFSVIKYYKYALVGISALMAVYGILVLLNRSRQGLRRLAQEYWTLRKKWHLGPLVLVVLLLNCFLIPVNTRFSTSATVAMNYSLASQGLNPNGSRFNQGDLLSTEILERAIEKGALEGITAQDLKNTLQVRPAVQGSSSSKDSYFISTQYVIQYNANEKTAVYDGQKLLTLVTQAYKEWFVREYSENTSMLKLDFTEAEEQDYLDTCSYLTKMAAAIGAYMYNMSGEEQAFRSSTNGETFQSLSSRAYAVSNTLVEKLQAYVMEEGVSKDAGQFISRMSVTNVFLDFDARKAAASNENTLEAISMYENDLARIVLVPTYDVNNQFYMSQTRIGIDDFAASADEYAGKKVEIYGDIAKNNHTIEQLAARTVPSGENAKAEELIKQVEQELTKIAAESDELVKEYSARQSNKYMRISVSSAESQAKSLVFNIILLTLMFAVALRLCWFAFAEGKIRK